MVRIQFSRQTVKGLQLRLYQAYQQGHVSRVRRISALLELVMPHTPVAVLSVRWGISPACIYDWLKVFMLDGWARVAYRRRRGGRRAKLTQTQKKQLCQHGAKYHTSQSTREFFEQHQDRITVCQLLSYSPDYNPIEYLWRKTKQPTTHNKYFEHYEQLAAAVNPAAF